MTNERKTMNTAVMPVSKLEEDSYDWWARHEQVLSEQQAIDPEIVLIGDSITHFWGRRALVGKRARESGCLEFRIRSLPGAQHGLRLGPHAERAVAA
ncbi:hypothetical protein OMP38_27305 [Cohnella ginsengisoli]|uniref:SGNH hydrolase-type esterase domain-containing protein n=1 Tax=Cohnella ginsengisoli TaxID=425004 RepID=A0A9X4KMF9_9BACL|nr:hypothetical protein [Cohnella ginsengisoli]MDG0794124.1 hypothetical protein [Cohnella ginsengisoli]